MLVKLKAKSEMHVTAPLGRNSGNDFDGFSFLFLEDGSWISKLLCNYPTRNANS